MIARLLLWLILAGCSQHAAAQAEKSSALVFEPPRQDLGTLREGEPAVLYLRVRNSGERVAQIVDLQASCGCTTAEPESRLLMPGDFTRVKITIDTFAKQNKIQKRITLTDDLGLQSSALLTMRVVENPHAAASQRSIFDGKCASCHAEPARGLRDGAAIFAAVCAMCHGERGGGASGPDLRGHEAVMLARVIAVGTGTHHMPGFARRAGGPLTPAQIDALSRWLATLDEQGGSR